MYPTSKYLNINIKQTLIEPKGEIDSNTEIVGDFCTPLSIIGRTFRQKSVQKQQT